MWSRKGPRSGALIVEPAVSTNGLRLPVRDQRHEITQNRRVHDAYRGPTLVATEFAVLASDEHHYATATLRFRRFVSQDRQLDFEGGSDSDTPKSAAEFNLW
jgi:hypothetical protein